MIIVLTFIVETAVVRHYGFAAIFITPLTLLLAEAVTLGHEKSDVLLDPFAGTGAAPFVAENYKDARGVAIELMPVGAFLFNAEMLLQAYHQTN